MYFPAGTPGLFIVITTGLFAFPVVLTALNYMKNGSNCHRNWKLVKVKYVRNCLSQVRLSQGVVLSSRFCWCFQSHMDCNSRLVTSKNSPFVFHHVLSLALLICLCVCVLFILFTESLCLRFINAAVFYNSACHEIRLIGHFASVHMCEVVDNWKSIRANTGDFMWLCDFI